MGSPGSCADVSAGEEGPCPLRAADKMTSGGRQSCENPEAGSKVVGMGLEG